MQIDSELVDYMATDGGDSGLGATVARVDVDTMMVTLSERERQLLQMRYIDGMTDCEMAEHLGEHEEAVKTAVRRARAKLRFRFGRRPA